MRGRARRVVRSAVDAPRRHELALFLTAAPLAEHSVSWPIEMIAAASCRAAPLAGPPARPPIDARRRTAVSAASARSCADGPRRAERGVAVLGDPNACETVETGTAAGAVARLGSLVSAGGT